MTTVGEMASDMATEFGEPYDTDDDVATLFQNFVIEGYGKIVRSGRWFFQNGEETITPVNAQKTYSLSGNVSEVKSVWDAGNGTVVKYTPVERLIARGLDLTATGDAVTNWYYEDIGSSQEVRITLYPIPNTTAVANGDLTVFTLERPSSLTSSSTIPLPTEYVELLRVFVRGKVLLNSGDFQAYLQLNEEFNQDLLLLNTRFSSPSRAGSSLLVKQKLKQVHQAPGTNDGG